MIKVLLQIVDSELKNIVLNRILSYRCLTKIRLAQIAGKQWGGDCLGCLKLLKIGGKWDLVISFWLITRLLTHQLLSRE